ncbi:MAG TPA: NAD(P)/FAD-dependent oxidoreductase [Thermoanaerobaculia bacterium]
MPLSTEAPSYPHVPIDTILRAIREHNKPTKKHVVILGAGMAGMVAARELLAVGHTVEILEGSDRVGGRVMTHHFKDGTYAELGAMRVPSSHDYTLHYIKALGLDPKLIPFINSTNAGFWDLHDVIARKNEAQAKIYPLFDFSEYLKQNTPSGGAIFGMLQDNLINMLTEAEKAAMFEGRADTDFLRYLSTLSLGQFLLEAAGFNTREVIGLFTSLEVWWDKALTMFLRDEMVGTGVGLQTLDGGLSQLPDKLGEQLERHILKRKEVLAVRRLANGADVVIRDRATQQIETKHCDYLLCTIPFSVLRRLELTGFSFDKVRAVRSMSYANATKVAIDCKERFWQSKYGIFGGSSVSDHIQRQTYYPVNELPVEVTPQAADDFAQTPHRRAGLHSAALEDPRIATRGISAQAARDSDKRPGALLGAYCWDRDARRLGAVSNDERARIVVENIRRFHPEIDQYVVDHASIDWEEHHWTGGAFCFLQPGELEAYYPAAIRPEGRVFFAGEHCSTDQGWIQGALIASLRAVDEIVSV